MTPGQRPPSHPAHPRVSIAQKLDVRTHATVLARIQTAQLLKMNEPEIAGLIQQIESDPLFQKLLYPPKPQWKVLSFQPHPRTRLSSSFYEMNEGTLPAEAPADVVNLLEERAGVLSLIQKMGRETFERLFLRAEENITPEELAEECGLAPEQVKRVQDFLLSFSVHAEFFDPSSRNALPEAKGATGKRVVRLARIQLSPDGEIQLELTAPHLARGRYNIRYDRFQALAQSEELGLAERRHLRAFIRKLELVNWRQNTLFRLLDLLCHMQKSFLRDRDPLKKQPVSQRQMARRLSVVPSTVNRAIQGRSVLLPWGEEVLLEDLFYSRKELCVDALEALELEDADFNTHTDTELQKNLQKLLGLLVPRRTINTYRHLVSKNNEDPPSKEEKAPPLSPQEKASGTGK